MAFLPLLTQVLPTSYTTYGITAYNKFGKIRKRTTLVLNRIPALYWRCEQITFIKSLLFCLTTLSACHSKLLDTCRLHTTRLMKVVLTIATVWVTTAFHIRGRVDWTFAPHSCHVIKAATYKHRDHNPTVPFVWLRKEEVDAHGERPGSLTQRQGRYENNLIIPSKTMNILFRKPVSRLKSQSEAENAVIISDCYADSYLFEIQTFEENAKAPLRV